MLATTVKTCSKCGKSKGDSEFRHAQCYACINAYQREYRASNPDRHRAYSKKYRTADPEKIRARDRARRAVDPDKKRAADRARYAANPETASERRAANRDKFNEKQTARRAEDRERFNAQQRAYRAADPGKAREQANARRAADPGKFDAKNARRRAMKTQQTPSWSEVASIAEFYKNRPEGMHVDHIIPLKGQEHGVSGLHVLANLQYLSGPENSAKCNRFSPDEHSWRTGYGEKPRFFIVSVMAE